MGKSPPKFAVGHAQGYCRACRAKFVGPGDRCPPCAQRLRERKRGKRR
jgi:hypothetical protein